MRERGKERERKKTEVTVKEMKKEDQMRMMMIESQEKGKPHLTSSCNTSLLSPSSGKSRNEHRHRQHRETIIIITTCKFANNLTTHTHTKTLVFSFLSRLLSLITEDVDDKRKNRCNGRRNNNNN